MTPVPGRGDRAVDNRVNARLEPHGWTWHRDSASLRKLRAGDVFYSVPLTDMRTSAEALDWIFQLRQKSWLTDEELGAVLFALDELLRPQQHLCSGGTEHGPIDVARVLEWSA